MRFVMAVYPEAGRRLLTIEYMLISLNGRHHDKKFVLYKEDSKRRRTDDPISVQTLRKEGGERTSRERGPRCDRL